MTTPEQRWDGPIQDAIRRHDAQQGHVSRVSYFRPPQFPNGGATVYVEPSRSGNPYARIDEDTSLPRPVVTVELPPFEEDR